MTGVYIVKPAIWIEIERLRSQLKEIERRRTELEAHIRYLERSAGPYRPPPEPPRVFKKWAR